MSVQDLRQADHPVGGSSPLVASRQSTAAGVKGLVRFGLPRAFSLQPGPPLFQTIQAHLTVDYKNVI